jgi:hypothetical protein
MRRLAPIALALAFLTSASPADAANRLYSKYRQALVSYSSAGLSAAIDLATDTIKIAAVTGSYTPNTTTDQFYTAISANVVGTPQTLTYASSAAGLYKSSNNPAFTIPASTTVTYLVIYKDTGTAGTSPLLAIFDTGTNIPFTQGSSSGTLNVTMDVGAGWFTP